MSDAEEDEMEAPPPPKVVKKVEEVGEMYNMPIHALKLWCALPGPRRFSRSTTRKPLGSKLIHIMGCLGDGGRTRVRVPLGESSGRATVPTAACGPSLLAFAGLLQPLPN